jgi:hypothetical protein
MWSLVLWLVCILIVCGSLIPGCGEWMMCTARRGLGLSYTEYDDGDGEMAWAADANHGCYTISCSLRLGASSSVDMELRQWR